jgi:hypothetical protein
VLASAICLSFAAFSFSSCCRKPFASASWAFSLSLSDLACASLALVCARSSTSALLSASDFLRSASARLVCLGLPPFQLRLLLFCRRAGDGGRRLLLPLLLLLLLLLGGGRGFFLLFVFLRCLLGSGRRVGLAQIADGRGVDVLGLGERSLDRLGRHRRRNLHGGADVQRLGEVAHARLRVLVLVDLEHAEQDVDLRHDPVGSEAVLLRERDRLLKLASGLVEVAVAIGRSGALAERLEPLHRFLGVRRASRPHRREQQQLYENQRDDPFGDVHWAFLSPGSPGSRRQSTASRVLRGRSGPHIPYIRRRKGWGRRAPVPRRGSTIAPGTAGRGTRTASSLHSRPASARSCLW